MRCIISRNVGNDSLCQQPFRQLLTCRQRVEHRNAAQFFQTRRRKLRIATTGLNNDHLRDEQIEIVPPIFPPFLR